MERTGSVRLAMRSDLDQIVSLYLACFPQRVREVFGDRDQRILIRDYLGFFLSWDPGGNWVYVEGDTVLGWIIAPCRYAPWRAAFAHGQVFRWGLHFLKGQYGWPIPIVKRVLGAGWALNADPQVRQMWGQPFIHGLAVEEGVRRQGVATELVRRVLAVHRKQGSHGCFAVIRPGNTPVISLLTKLGFTVSHVTPAQEPVMIFEALVERVVSH